MPPKGPDVLPLAARGLQRVSQKTPPPGRSWLLAGLIVSLSMPSASAAEQPRPTELAMPGDRPLRVAYAQPGQSRAIVYLHGMCGHEEGADLWADLATAHGTLITLRADVPCGDRPGYKWPKDAGAIHARIERALDAVGELRDGQLTREGIWLVGYSQGAHRAERLAAAYPHRYRLLVLGGPPTAASPDRLRHAHRVAILGGELEDTSHMIEGYLALHLSGIDADFVTLPRAGHGSFGPEGRRVMNEALSYLLEGASPPRTLPPSRAPSRASRNPGTSARLQLERPAHDDAPIAQRASAPRMDGER